MASGWQLVLQCLQTKTGGDGGALAHSNPVPRGGAKTLRTGALRGWLQSRCGNSAGDSSPFLSTPDPQHLTRPRPSLMLAIILDRV